MTTGENWCAFEKNKTEKILRNFLENTFKSVKSQQTFDWCKNPETNRHFRFDFVLSENKLIIELDGQYHMVQVSNWTCPEEQQKRDFYKMKLALEQGYRFIRILQDDVIRNKYDWKTKLKDAIETSDEVVFICANNEYEPYKQFIRGLSNP